MRLGFIGTGHITQAVVGGLCEAPDPPPITLSPRNEAKADALRRRFPDRVSVAASNQAVVDESDVVVLAVRPPQLEAVASGLRFRPDQLVLSFVATVPAVQVRGLVAPVRRVIRVCPLPTLALRLGPVLIHPANETVRELFGRIGTPIELGDERALEVLWATTAMIAPFFALEGEVAAWASDAGVEPAAARAYVAAMFHALGVLGRAGGELGFQSLVSGAETKGGLNEQALRSLRAAGVYDTIRSALDSIHTRLLGTPPRRG